MNNLTPSAPNLTLQVLRSRQKQGNALPINLVGRDALELRDDLDLERLMLGSNSGKSASFLRVGDILLERLDAGDVAAPHVLGDNPRQRVERREDRGPIGRTWGLMRVSEDLRRRPLNRNTQILAADGIWDPDIQGYFFEEKSTAADRSSRRGEAEAAAEVRRGGL